MKRSVSERAILEWRENHGISSDWYVVRGHYRAKDKKPYVVLHAKDNNAEYRFCLQCAGNGHYFKTKKEMRRWMWDNGWAKDLYIADDKNEISEP